MKLFPDFKFKIETNLKKSEALTLLSKNVEPEQHIPLSFIEKDNPISFQGEIIENIFSLKRRRRYGRPPVPLIHGEIHSEANGSSIVVTVKYGLPVKIIFWLVFAFIVAQFVFTSISMIKNHSFNPIILVTLLFPLAGYFLITANFKPECQHIRSEFEEIFR